MDRNKDSRVKIERGIYTKYKSAYISCVEKDTQKVGAIVVH